MNKKTVMRINEEKRTGMDQHVHINPDSKQVTYRNVKSQDRKAAIKKKKSQSDFWKSMASRKRLA